MMHPYMAAGNENKAFQLKFRIPKFWKHNHSESTTQKLSGYFAFKVILPVGLCMADSSAIGSALLCIKETVMMWHKWGVAFPI